MIDTIPSWLLLVLGFVGGALVALVLGPASLVFWEAVYVLRRWCTIVGAVVLAAAAFGGAGYLLWRAVSS